MLGFFHTKFGAAVRHEHIEFFKAAFIKQQINTLARGQLAFGVLRGDTALATSHAGLITAGLKFTQNIFHRASPLSTHGVSQMLRLHKAALTIGLTAPQQKAYFAKLHSLHTQTYANCKTANI